MDFEQQKKLERIKTDNQLLIEYHKLVVENSMRAQRGLLLCHGGAITAIMMSGQDRLLDYCFAFGLGAGLAVLSSGLGYVANYCYMRTWKDVNKWLDRISITSHIAAVAVYIASISLFFWNVWKIFQAMGA